MHKYYKFKILIGLKKNLFFEIIIAIKIYKVFTIFIDICVCLKTIYEINKKIQNS